MEFLDKLVIPQPDYNLNLLNYFLILGLSIFLAYAALLLGSTIMSVYFKNKSKSHNDNYANLSRDYISLVTDSWIYAFGLGIIPFLAIIFIYTQLLHKQPVAIVSYLTFSFFLFLISTVLVYRYKKSLHLSNIFTNIKEKISGTDEIINDLDTLSNDAESGKNRAGTWSVLIMFIALWFFVGSISFAMTPDDWWYGGILSVLFSGNSLLKFLQFLTAAFAFTSITFVFRRFFWDADSVQVHPAYVEFAKKTNLWVGMISSLLLPIFIVLSLFAIPRNSLNPAIFGATMLSLFLVIVVLQQIYFVLKGRNSSFIKYAFYSFIIIFGLIAFKDKTAFSVANRSHVLVLDKEYKVYKEAFLASLGIEAAPINAFEIYSGRCAACHRDEDAPTAPAHKNIIQKYLDQADPVAALVQFIQNPQPVNPKWPPMPNQGLTPQEAKAVAEYLFEKYSAK